MVIAHERPHSPAVALDQFAEVRATVVSFCEKVTAKSGFGIGLNDREVDIALEVNQEGLVVGDYLGQ